MKKFSIASVALCALLAVSSCGTDNALTFIPVTYNETSALEEGAQDSIKISMVTCLALKKRQIYG